MICCHVNDTDDKAQEKGRHFLWRMGHPLRGPQAYFSPPGSALSGANDQLEGLEKHQKSRGLLASLRVTLVTVWVEIIVVLTSRCPSHS